jgi:uncharacterized protein (DUF2062 family)
MALLGRFRAIVSQVLLVDDTPHRLALAFALGVFLGMSPLIGLHTVLALLLAWAFRLNRLVTLSGAFVNNPWSIIPIYTFSTWVGTIMLGTELRVDDIDWHRITLGTLVHDLENLIIPFILGSAVVGLVAAVLAYFVIRKAAED